MRGCPRVPRAARHVSVPKPMALAGDDSTGEKLGAECQIQRLAKRTGRLRHPSRAPRSRRVRCCRSRTPPHGACTRRCGRSGTETWADEASDKHRTRAVRGRSPGSGDPGRDGPALSDVVLGQRGWRRSVPIPAGVMRPARALCGVGELPPRAAARRNRIVPPWLRR